MIRECIFMRLSLKQDFQEFLNFRKSADLNPSSTKMNVLNTQDIGLINNNDFA